MGCNMNMSAVRNDFPTIRKGGGVYLDSACQSLRPDQVIRAVTEYYENYPSCGGRSIHGMSAKVSLVTDEAREKAAGFFGTDDPECYIFTKNCTEGINTVAKGFRFRKGDAVVTTDTEHNSNHAPWTVLSEEIGLKRRYSKARDDGEFDIESFKKVMGKDVKLVSVHHASNVTGCVVPIKEITEIAHDIGAKVLVDGSQAAPHMKTDLKRMDVDYYSLSVHKMLGPSGMGILYGKRECLESLKPLTTGGGTVGMATYERVTSAPIPDKFEAGLQNYSGIAGTKAALEYLTSVGMDKILEHDRDMMRSIFKRVGEIEGLSVIGPNDPDRRCGVFSFNVEGLSPHDVAMMLDKMDNIMIRSGMHCTHPFFVSKGIEGSARASVYLYNNEEDIERFAAALINIAETFGDKK
ncbi:cysteine desulfurase [Candidatus Methanoplasma termitum]|uniref:cysteine desulfurase n=2 Tax=Candidatus Methanoplasma termitum TaxID=1577791 RepID=A0A0A7LG46_9ARCH|nr:cysteine desulfurase [Candidatus Methanoplasma termitum]